MAEYKKHIGHYDHKLEEEFDHDNRCMVAKMNNVSIGGNNDNYIDIDEFLSYLASRSDFWASEDPTVRDKYRHWSFLWEKLSFMGIETPWFKKDIIVDSRVNRDFFLSAYKVVGAIICLIIGTIIWVYKTNSFKSTVEHFNLYMRDMMEKEYETKLKDLVACNDFYK